MDAKTAKRIDSLYRNMSSFWALSIISLFVPLLLLFVFPLSLAYLYLRAKLLRQVDAGDIVLDRTEKVEPGRKNDLTTAQKVDFVRANASRLLAPSIILVVVLLAIGVLLLMD